MPSYLERVSRKWSSASRSQFREIVALGLGIEGAAPLDTPAVKELLAYARFVDELERVTNEHYRRTAIGKKNDAVYRRESQRIFKSFWKQMGLEGSYRKKNLFRFLEERFGVEVYDGRTAGYLDLHYGHRVVDDEITIEQYGHEARPRFVATDGPVSNGFQSWAWDFRSEHGGTADGNRVLQHRPAYANGLRHVWQSLNDPALRSELEEQLEEATKQDVEIAARTPIATFPGLTRRLEIQGRMEILKALQTEGHAGEELERRFIAAYRQAVFESSIVAHEGRHAIDRRLKLAIDTEEREYRAKLSEVALVAHPRPALGSILTMDGDSPHARANRRIGRQLIDWMKDHREEIREMDTTRPLLPQLDRLTNDQLRAAFASMDPLAHGY